MLDLLDALAEERRMDMYETAIAVGIGVNEPGKANLLLEDPDKPIEATGMIAIPKKKKVESG